MKFKLVDVLQLLLVGLSWVLLFLVIIFLVVVESTNCQNDILPDWYNSLIPTREIRNDHLHHDLHSLRQGFYGTD